MPRGAPKGMRYGGRVKGTPNKATAEIKELARAFTKDALETLCDIMKHGEMEGARVSAAKELLDRGYGKPNQSVSGPDEGPIEVNSSPDLSGLTNDELKTLEGLATAIARSGNDQG